MFNKEQCSSVMEVKTEIDLPDSGKEIDEFTFVDVNTEVKEEPKEEIVEHSYKTNSVIGDEKTSYSGGKISKNRLIEMQKNGPFCSKSRSDCSQEQAKFDPLAIYTVEGNVMNNVCGKPLEQEDHVKAHMEEHIEVGPFTCVHCGVIFSKKQQLHGHMNRHFRKKKPTGKNKNKVKQYTCNECEKVFADKNILVKHMRIHIEGVERPFLCSYCGKSFFQNSCLVRHMKIHTREKCAVCEQEFSRPHDRKLHERIHKGENLFKCSNCGKVFARKDTLKHHMMIHTGMKPFECNICGKGFSRKVIWKQHKRVHSGEKPFQCKVCGKAFSQSSHLAPHMRIHKRDQESVRVDTTVATK